jgi:hypothetical protein
MKKKDLNKLIKRIEETITTEDEIRALNNALDKIVLNKTTSIWYHIRPHEDDSPSVWGDEVRVPNDPFEFLDYVFDFCELEYSEAVDAIAVKEGIEPPKLSEEDAKNKIKAQFDNIVLVKKKTMPHTAILARFDRTNIETLSGGLIDYDMVYGYYRIKDGKSMDDCDEFSFEFLGESNEFRYRW